MAQYSADSSNLGGYTTRIADLLVREFLVTGLIPYRRYSFRVSVRNSQETRRHAPKNRKKTAKAQLKADAADAKGVALAELATEVVAAGVVVCGPEDEAVGVPVVVGKPIVLV